MRNSTSILFRNGVSFQEIPGKNQLIIQHKNRIIDYWLADQKWKIRSCSLYGTGIESLLKVLGVKNERVVSEEAKKNMKNAWVLRKERTKNECA